MSTFRVRVLSFALAGVMLAFAAVVGLVPHSTAFAQTPGSSGSSAAPAAASPAATTGVTSSTTSTIGTTAPVAVPTFPTVPAPPVPGVRFGHQNNHVVVCPPRLLAAATGGTGDVDMVTLLKNLKVNTGDVKAYWFVPVDLAKITDRDDLDDRIEPNSTLLGGSKQVISMTAGTYYFGVTYWDSQLDYLGVAPIVDGAVLTDLSEYATSQTCSAPVAAAPVTTPVTTTTTTTAATVAKPKPLGKGGIGFSNLAMVKLALFAPENKSLLGLLGVLALALAAIPFSLAISAWAKRRQLATTRAR